MPVITNPRCLNLPWTGRVSASSGRRMLSDRLSRRRRVLEQRDAIISLSYTRPWVHDQASASYTCRRLVSLCEFVDVSSVSLLLAMHRHHRGTPDNSNSNDNTVFIYRHEVRRYRGYIYHT